MQKYKNIMMIRVIYTRGRKREGESEREREVGREREREREGECEREEIGTYTTFLQIKPHSHNVTSLSPPLHPTPASHSI